MKSGRTRRRREYIPPVSPSYLLLDDAGSRLLLADDGSKLLLE